MARARNTDERREQIARGLQQVMAAKGYDGASVSDVARAAGLTPGLVHYHFANKLEILLAVLERLASRHAAALEAALSAARGPLAQIAAFVDVHLALDRADPETLACWIALGGEALRQPRVRKAYAKALAATVARLEAILEEARAARLVRVASTAAAASAIVAAIQGSFVLAATAPDVIPRGTAAASVVAMASGLLRPTRPLRSRARGTP